ncbi:MAG: deoxyguanosinetriphosphate triphosphohydrolase [Rickettsiaceae bacterium]|nr:deoxyguanosinetriphosphate triphosphohydrolase [Rickettsiaceae bacterium]
MLASYASDPENSKGRLYEEKPTPYRNAFQRDKDRIIHSNTFRRLQYKTQVFINHEGDHYRNRLTHSIEVAAIARSISRDLGGSEDLAECIALAHDLGHTPFGHVGEDVLKECMKDYGGFCHNSHAIKLLTKLERRYCAYDGLNLSWEVLEGIAKHNGPLTGEIPEAIAEYNMISDLKLYEYSSIEAQVASLSDDITYNCHDLEDGVRAGMITIDELGSLNVIDKIVSNVTSKFTGMSKSRIIFEIVRELAHIFIEDLLAKTRENIQTNNIKTSDEVRRLGKPVVEFSEDVVTLIKILRAFLKEKVYQNHRIILIRFKCKKIIRELFDLYFHNNDCLPPDWFNRTKNLSETKKARVIADFIAGMTDRYALDEYNSFFSINTNF